VVATILITAVAGGCLGGYQQTERERLTTAGHSVQQPGALVRPAAGVTGVASTGDTGRLLPTVSVGPPLTATGTTPAPGRAGAARDAEGKGRPVKPGKTGKPDKPGKPGRSGQGGSAVPAGMTGHDAGPSGGAGGQAPRVDCSRRKCIALTFDDGPGPYTGRLLDILAARRVRATFFVLGSQATSQPNLVRRIHQAGHEIGNHSYSHLDLTELSAGEVRTELNKTQQAIHGALGWRPRLLRPPYGSTDDRVLQVAKQMKLPQIFWTVDTLDWQIRESGPVAARATSKAGRGGIILMHDTRPTTVEAVPSIVDRLRRQGFELVTVPELNAGQPFLAGGRYKGGPA
jgi:peptidoglycan/xylan/chitin deacetylase (PgdA/CDA1 family)